MRFPIVQRWLETIRPASMLEVGCGMGAMAYRLAQRCDYKGYEPDVASCRTAAQRLAGLPGSEVINGVVPERPDGQFDLVVAFEVLEHIEDDLSALRTWARWLGQGGHVLVSVRAHPRRFGAADEAVGHYRRYRRSDLVRLMRLGGLEGVTVEPWGMPFGYPLEGTRNLLFRRRSADARPGTAGSGQTYQPPAELGRVVELAVRPVAALQAPFRQTDLGVGFIAVGRLP